MPKCIVDELKAELKKLRIKREEIHWFETSDQFIPFENICRDEFNSMNASELLEKYIQHRCNHLHIEAAEQLINIVECSW